MPSKKTASKKNKKKLDFWHQPLSPKIFWPLLGVLFLFFIISIINFFSLWQLRSDMKVILSAKANINEETGRLINMPSNNTELMNVDENSAMELAIPNIIELEALNNQQNVLIDPETEQIMDELMPSTEEQLLIEEDLEQDTPIEEVLVQQNMSGTVASFGDSFSGLAYIDQNKTDLFWDENVTAFTLPPLYNLAKQSDCASRDCGLSREEIDPQRLCLTSGCLRKDENNNLWFNDKALLLPPEFRGEIIREVTLFNLSDKWLIGIVSGALTQERGWVYSFDGLAFSPLITDNTNYQIYPRYQRGGGKIFFGGDDDDFLVLYAGYDGIAYRFRNNNIEDVSKFFGLRVTAGGFTAQIFKTGSAKDANYYICGLSEFRPLLLKIWSQNENVSGGALDFSSLALKDSFATTQILCALSGEHNLAIAAKKGSSQELWNFTDLGFDHSRERQVQSVNLQRKDSAVKAAILANLELLANDSNYSFYLANDENNFESTEPFLWHNFNNEQPSIYWQLKIQPNQDTYRSPWFFHLSRLDYLFSD